MTDRWKIEDETGAELTVRAPNGFAVELDANSADPRERFAYFAIRQQSRDIDQLRDELAAAIAERDDYRDEFSGLCHTLSVGSEGRPEMTAADWRKRADDGIDFLTRPLIAERDALKLRAEQAEARLAAIDNAPTLARVRKAANGNGHSWATLDYAELPPIGTELIARPEKE